MDAVLDPWRPIALAGQLIERDNGGGMRRHSAQFSAAITTDPKPISCASWPAACFCSSLSLAISAAVERLVVAARPLIAKLDDQQKQAAGQLAQEMGLGSVVMAALN